MGIRARWCRGKRAGIAIIDTSHSKMFLIVAADAFSKR